MSKIAAHIVTGSDRTIRSVSTLEPTPSASHLFTGADKKVCPDTPHAVTCYCQEVQGSQFVIHPLPFILYVAEVQTCRCDALSRVL